MTEILKTIGISVAVVIVALLLTGNIGGNDGMGGTYEITKQYFAEGIEASDVTVTDDLTVTDDTTFGTSAATTSINYGKACWTITTVNGSTTYVSFNSTGNLATSSTSCN